MRCAAVLMAGTTVTTTPAESGGSAATIPPLKIATGLPTSTNALIATALPTIIIPSESPGSSK